MLPFMDLSDPLGLQVFTAAVDVHVLKWLALVCKATVRTVMGKVVTLEIAAVP